MPASGRNREVSKNRYFMGFRRCFDSGLLTELLTLPMFGRVAECGAMCCGEKVTFRYRNSCFRCCSYLFRCRITVIGSPGPQAYLTVVGKDGMTSDDRGVATLDHHARRRALS